MKEKNLIFDIDGTLWDSTGLVAKGYNLQIADEGIDMPEVTPAVLKTLFGKTMTEIADRLFGFVEVPERYSLMERCMVREHEVLESDPCHIAFPAVVETLEKLAGKVNIYLPDLKYSDNTLAAALSGAGDYFETATAAIKEMVRQTGAPQWDGDKLVRGTVIRHLVLPGNVENSLKVLDLLGETFRPGQILVSLMRQYTPLPGLKTPLDRSVTDREYEAVLSWMFLNDLQGFTQEKTAANREFIPDFQTF